MHAEILERALRLLFADPRMSMTEALHEAAEQLGVDTPAMPTDASTFRDEACGRTDDLGVLVPFTDGAELQVSIVLTQNPR